MAKVDISRVGPGTIELVRDATTGEYSINNVGFETINKLSIPDLGTQAVTAATTTEQKTATDLTDTAVDTQTQRAFRMPIRATDDGRVDTTDDMLAEAKKTSAMLSDTFTRPNMRDVTGDRITSPLDIQSPTERVFDRPGMREVTGDTRVSAQEAAPQEDIETADFTDYERSLLELTPEQRQKREPTFLKGLFAEPRGVEVARGKQKFERTEPTMADVAGPVRTSEIPDRNRGQLGVRTTRPDTTLDTGRFAGATAGTLSDPVEKQDVKPDVKRSAVQTFSTSLRTTKDSILGNIKTPMMAAVDFVSDAMISPVQRATNNFNKSYFNTDSQGRISGNPTSNVFSGLNAQSAFGNLSKTAANRIAKREETINTKNVSQEFIENTNRMKNQLKDYNNNKDSDGGVTAAKNEAAATAREQASVSQYDRDGDSGGSAGGKVVCTMMNQRYGFGSFRNKIWLKFHKNYSQEYQRGYHKLFLPLVNIAKKEGIFNTIVRKILEHMGRHVTADMFQIMRNKKSDKLGRIYRKIFEPICYWLGNK